MEECNENIDEAKLNEIALFEHKNKCACSCFYCFGCNRINSQILGSLLILPINTSSVIKKMFLNMIMLIKQKTISHIKWEK